MRKYTALEIEIVLMEVNDVVRTSGGGGNIKLDENELPLVPIN